jgi:hypothetical protein
MQNLLGRLIQVQPFTLQIHCKDLLRGGPFEEEKEELESPMVSKQKLMQLKNFCWGLVPWVPWTTDYEQKIWIRPVPSSGKWLGNHAP